MVLAHVSQENIEHKVGSNLMAKKKVRTTQICYSISLLQSGLQINVCNYYFFCYFSVKTFKFMESFINFLLS